MPVMRADRVGISWDEGKKSWLVRIESGEEVIRRYWKEGKGADEAKLRSAALQMAKDEGYEVDAAAVSVKK
jgi:hypothetical protein